MFNLGSGEMMMIAVVALLVLGPSRLPELARGIGKFIKEFRRQTDDVRGMVEREFYKMDSAMSEPEVPITVRSASDAVALGGAEQPEAPADSVSATEPAPVEPSGEEAQPEAHAAPPSVASTDKT